VSSLCPVSFSSAVLSHRHIQAASQQIRSRVRTGTVVKLRGVQWQGARAAHFYKWLGTGAPWVAEQHSRNWPNRTDQGSFQGRTCGNGVPIVKVFKNHYPPKCTSLPDFACTISIFLRVTPLDPGSGRARHLDPDTNFRLARLRSCCHCFYETTSGSLLPITKALTTTTNCTRRGKKVEGDDNKIFYVCPSPFSN